VKSESSENNKEIQYVSISRTLIIIVSEILRKSIKDSEKAVCDIMEKMQFLSNISEKQKNLLDSALVEYYRDSDNDELKSTLKDAADAIFEAAVAGDFDKINEVSNDEKYVRARKATKQLHDQLQVISQDTTMDSSLMPVMMALQFHDKMRQELESIIKCFDNYCAYVYQVAPNSPPTEPHEGFWQRTLALFTNVEAREIVSKHARIGRRAS
jgi:hypothetical protein